MKTAVSLPDELFRRAEQFAARLGIGRSHLYALALAEYLDTHRTEGVTEALNELYPNEASEVASDVAEAQAAAIAEEW